MPLNPIHCPQINQINGVNHGFFTRQGGISQGIYQSLNIGPSSDDNAENVRTNRQSVVSYLGSDDADIATPWQHHSADVVVATENWLDARPKADGVITATPNLPIGCVTADCGPVLFCDPVRNIIGAAHAGWRGATGGILDQMVKTMIEMGSNPSDIIATLGPTIGPDHYEVGPEFVDNLKTLSPENSKFLRPSARKDHAMFNLPGYSVERLTTLGVKASWTGHCTYKNADRFFSYRRMTHKNEPDYGRQISAIMLRKPS